MMGCTLHVVPEIHSGPKMGGGGEGEMRFCGSLSRALGSELFLGIVKPACGSIIWRVWE